MAATTGSEIHARGVPARSRARKAEQLGNRLAQAGLPDEVDRIDSIGGTLFPPIDVELRLCETTLLGN
jgi:hypothetical protein